MLSTGSASAKSPSTRCLVVTSSRGTSGCAWVTTVISSSSTVDCSSWMSTVPVWPASTLTPSTWVALYPMNAARTAIVLAGTLLKK